MKSHFVPIYLRFVAVVLSLTALAKLWAVFMSPLTLCIEEPLFGSFQPVSNDVILGTAAATELFVVGLILFSTPRWLPCLASVVWGSICLAARVYFIIAGVECNCLGWLAKPGPETNSIASLLALALVAGGMIALNVTSRDAKLGEDAGSSAKGPSDSDCQRGKMENVIRIILLVGASACFVVGLKWMYWTIAYPAPGVWPAAVFAFMPIVFVAPRSRIFKKPVFFLSLGFVEVVVIACGLALEWNNVVAPGD